MNSEEARVNQEENQKNQLNDASGRQEGQELGLRVDEVLNKKANEHQAEITKENRRGKCLKCLCLHQRMKK